MFGVFAVVIAIKAKVVFNLIQDANSIVLVSIAVPFVAGVWWKKANRTGVLASMAAGFVTWAAATLFAPNLAGDVLGLLAGLVTLLVVTPLTQKFDAPRPVRNHLGQPVELTDRLGTLPLFRRVE